MRKWFASKGAPPSSPSSSLLSPAGGARENTRKISQRLKDNLHALEGVFTDCKDLTMHHWRYGPEWRQSASVVFLHTLTKFPPDNYLHKALQNLVPHELGPANTVTIEQVRDFFERHGAAAPSAELLDDLEQAVSAILDGKSVVFFDGWERAIAYLAIDVEHRQASEPITEPAVQGPHVSFIEALERNIGVVRSLIKSPRLKFEFFTAGAESKRLVAYGYMDERVEPEMLQEFKRRIGQIGREEILETSYLEEWVSDNRFTPFPQVRYTERPDTVVSALLDGKIVAMVNGSPSVLICPSSFMEFFMTSEDYYYRTVFSSLIRLIRVAAFTIALLLPSTYIALSTFHSELIPTVLLLAILNTREGIPFPAVIEALIMEFFFELLREAGIRLPRPIGSAVSIVGALVIGQAAIQSQIASPVMVIVVALTGIASFALPQYNMAIAVRILRFPLMFLAATFGGLGIMVGFIVIFLHLSTLKSLGRPYLASLSQLDWQRLRDAVLVLPRSMVSRTPRSRSVSHETPERKKTP